MKFRSSYGQNLLQHSRGVANIAATMAAELGLNVKLAKRAGLLHDIGKVPEQESELPHALLGMQWAEKFGENPEVVNAIGAHHDEVGDAYQDRSTGFHQLSPSDYPAWAEYSTRKPSEPISDSTRKSKSSSIKRGPRPFSVGEKND